MNIVKKRWFQSGLGLALLLLILWLLYIDRFMFTPLVIFVKALFLPFLLAGLLFYLTRPLAAILMKWHVPRKIAILLIFVLLIGVLTSIVNLLVPSIQHQFNRLVDNFPAMVNAVQEGITYWQQNQDSIPGFVTEAVNDAGDKLKQMFSNTGTFITNFLSNLVGLFFSLVVVPFILFYLLHDHEKFMPSVLRFLPKKREDEMRDVLRDMDNALASYIQGQVIVSACVGVMLLIGYFIIDLDYALLLALFGMVMNVIPFLGPFIAVTPALIAAWFQDPIMVIYVAIIMLIAQQIESNAISPQVMGRVLNVHPLTIILLILIGASLSGVLGMILIIPTYAVSKVIVQHGYKLLMINRRED